MKALWLFRVEEKYERFFKFSEKARSIAMVE